MTEKDIEYVEKVLTEKINAPKYIKNSAEFTLKFAIMKMKNTA